MAKVEATVPDFRENARAMTGSAETAVSRPPRSRRPPRTRLSLLPLDAKDYTVYLLTEDGQETLSIFGADTAESILTKYQATRHHIPFTDPVIMGCDVENKTTIRV